MSRKSKRELERALNSLGVDDGSIRDWIESKMSEGFNYNPGWGGSDHTGQVCVLEDGKVSYYVDRSDVPDWIDVDEDLPVR